MIVSTTDDTGERVEQESSPSAGPKATAAALSAEYGLGRHTVTIVDGDEEETFEVDHKHLKDYLGVSS